MDLGKQPLPIQQVYVGDVDTAFQETYNAIALLNRSYKITGGPASLIASVALSRGQAVNIFNGQLRLADASLSRPAVGVVTRAAAIGQAAEIMLLAGLATGLSGLTPNTLYYLGNAGALTTTRPVSGVAQCVGYALSATELLVHTSLDLIPAAGGGGSTVLSAQVVATMPQSHYEHEETFTLVGCTATTKLQVAMTAMADTEDNDPQLMPAYTAAALAQTGAFRLLLSFALPVSGTLRFNVIGV
jgi:hypothetical protein